MELIYLRKSQKDRTHKNETVEETLARHEYQLQEYALKEFGHYIDEKYIFREVVSGGEELSERSEFLKVLKLVEKGDVTGVIFLDTARISRTGIYGAGDIINIFFYTNTLVYTPQKTYDLSNEYDKKFLEMELLQSADFLNYTKKILMRGRRHSVVDLGLFVGSTAPYGYKKKKLDKGFTLEPGENADIVKMIFKMFLDGEGTGIIANYLNTLDVKPAKSKVWTDQIVRNILTTETYAGLLTWEKRKTVKKIVDGKVIKTRPDAKEFHLVKGQQEPLVSYEDFIKVQTKIKSHHSSHTPKGKELMNPLATLVICTCGRRMVRRPYNQSKLKRVYEIDKINLSNVLRTHKKESKLSLTDIADKLNVSKDQVAGWFSPKIEKMYLSKVFSDKWLELKELLNIVTDEFDKSILTYENMTPEDTLICINPVCNNVSSNLRDVETAILSEIQAHTEKFQYFLDNYEDEVKKLVRGNLKAIEKYDKDINKLDTRLSSVMEAYELKDYTREQFLERKKTIEDEKAILLEKKKELEKDKREDQVIRYKRAIPKLELCLQNYHTLSIENKNKLLSTIIDKVIYSKDKKSTKKDKYNFSLKLHLLI